MNELNEIKKLLGNDWTQFDVFYKETLRSEVELLNTINNYLLERKGKQLRPLLTLLSARISDGCNHQSILAATAVEMIHTATLLHDDVVDNADQRRGAASVKSKWKSTIAVLTGDYWLSQAFLLLVDNRQNDLLPWLCDCVKIMSEGELFQQEKTQKLNSSEADYFAIIGKKTAVLLATSLAVGATSAGADKQLAQTMYDIGYTMGLAFQIRDDIFDYEKNSQSGKPAGNDVREKKITLPLLYALQQADEKERRYMLKQVERAEKKSRSVQRVVDFVYRQRGLEYAESVMQQHSTKAIEMLHSLPESEGRDAMISLAHFMTTRKK